MKRILSGPLFGVCALALAATVAACGGGGGGSGATPPTSGGGGSTSSPGSTASPGATASPTQSASGTLAVSGVALANAKVTFTCGCNQGAGLISTDANGNYTITGSAPLAPSGSTNPPYTLQGHNVLVVGYSTSSATQAWTMQFVGNSPATNLNLSSSDSAAAATALYLFYEVAYNPTIKNSTDQTFDWFNFNTVSAWAQHLRTSPDAAETKLMSDITAAQNAGTSLFPYNPSWNPTTDGTNGTISSDISAVVNGGTSADAALPTPCPAVGQCTGAPTP